MLTFRLGTSAGENIASNLAPRIFEVCGGRGPLGLWACSQGARLVHYKPLHNAGGPPNGVIDVRGLPWPAITGPGGDRVSGYRGYGNRAGG
jgi:hypothetical protein